MRQLSQRFQQCNVMCFHITNCLKIRLVPSLHTCSLETNWVPGTVPDAGDTKVNETAARNSGSTQVNKGRRWLENNLSPLPGPDTAVLLKISSGCLLAKSSDLFLRIALLGNLSAVTFEERPDLI